jgi:hypothetical protein
LWLNPETDASDLEGVFKPFSDETMAYYTVARDAMKYPAQGEQPIPEWIYPELNTLF